MKLNFIKIKQRYFLFYTLLSCLPALGDPAATLSPQNISVGEYATLTLNLDASLDQEPQFPEIDGLDFRQGGTSSSYQIINGRSSRSETISYIVTASKPGEYTIPSVVFESGGQKYRTPKYTLRVSKTGSQIEAESDGKPLIFVERYFSKIDPYPGEPVTVTTKLYYRQNILEQRRSLSEEVRLRRLAAGQDEGHETVDGVRYKVLYYYDVIVPLEEGKTTISGDQIQLKVATQNERRRRRDLFEGFFDRAFTEYSEKTIATEENTIHVKKIPQTSKANSFSGIVGDFNLKASLSEQETTQGGSITLSIQLLGKGMLEGVSSLPIDLPKHIKKYEDKAEGKMSLNSSKQLISEKIFKYALVPQQSGTFDLGPIQITIFDPESEQFKTITADLEPLIVSENPEWKKTHDSNLQISTAAANTTTPRPKTPSVVTLGSDITDIIRKNTKLEGYFGGFTPNLPYFLWLLGFFTFNLCLLLLNYLGVFRTLRTLMKPSKSSILYRTFQSQASKVKDSPSRESLSEVYHSFRSFVGAKFDSPIGQLNRTEILTLLHKTKIPSNIQSETDRILQQIEKSIYLAQPDDQTNIHKLVQNLKSIADKLERR